MAVARLDFAEMRDEALKRAMRGSETATRMEQWITEAYLELALNWHHFELDETVSGQAVAAGSVSTAVPADCYVVTGVRLLDAAGAHLHRLRPEAASYAFGRASASAEKPETYVRREFLLEFPSPTDADYQVDIAYYRTPTLPDFSGSATSELGRVWDAQILRFAAGAALGHFHALDAVKGQLEPLNAFLERTAAIPVAVGSLSDTAGVSTMDRRHGGAQG